MPSHPESPLPLPSCADRMKLWMEGCLSQSCVARGQRLAPRFAACGAGLAADFGISAINPAAITIGSGVYLGRFIHIPDIPLIVENDVLIGPYVTFHKTGDSPSANTAVTVLRRGCWLAAHVRVRQGVTIGAGSTVAAGADVLDDVPDHVLVGGKPATILKRYERRTSE